MLMMSATPIPRTLAMTLFADLDVSTIDALPPGRTPVETRLFADTQARRGDRPHPRRDRRAAARSTGSARWSRPPRCSTCRTRPRPTQQLCAALPGRMIGLLHGRMPAAEKTAVMALFASGQIAGAGGDDGDRGRRRRANASLMVVEHAERFGLSQLHQLRGRVGRGAAASVCVLLYSAPLSDTAKARLKAMLETERRLRDLAPRPRDPRPGRAARRAPVGRGAAALRRPARRRSPAARSAPRRRSTCSTATPRRRRAAHRALAGRPCALPERLSERRRRWKARRGARPAHRREPGIELAPCRFTIGREAAPRKTRRRKINIPPEVIHVA